MVRRLLRMKVLDDARLRHLTGRKESQEINTDRNLRLEFEHFQVECFQLAFVDELGCGHDR